MFILKRNLLILICACLCLSCVRTEDLFSESINSAAVERFYLKFDTEHFAREGIAVPLYELSSNDEIGLIDCGVNKGEESFEDIYCILDLNEADIGVLGQADRGIPIQYNIPRHMCEYTTFMAPWHWNYRSGIGPPVLRKYTVEETQQVVGNNENNDDEYYCIPVNNQCSTPVPPPVTTRCIEAQLAGDIPPEGAWCRIDEDNNLSKIFCPAWDHSINSDNISRPNCCLGTYEVTGGDEGKEENDWGGNVKDCIGGPIRASDWDAYQETQYGELPIARIFYSWIMDTPRETLVVGPVNEGEVIFSSAPTATYFDGIEDLIFTDSSCPNCPGMFLSDVNNPILGSAFIGYPYFTLECLDSNYEALHRIHLIIREWNTQEEFLSFQDSDGRSGDPDVDGEEGSDCPYYEADEALHHAHTDCNDFADLDDYLEASDGITQSDLDILDDLNVNLDLPYPQIDYE